MTSSERKLEEQLVQIRAIAAAPPDFLSEIRIAHGADGEAWAYFFGHYMDDRGRRRYLCFTAWPNDEGTEPEEIDKLTLVRSGKPGEERAVRKSSGVPQNYPTEFREALENYYRALEQTETK